jgi:hypothetical protein
LYVDARVSKVREVEARVIQVREVEVGVRQVRKVEALARKIEVKSTTGSGLGQENRGQFNYKVEAMARKSRSSQLRSI